MSVPANKRKENKLTVHSLAQGLCCYTLKITANQKVFLPELNESLTQDINRAAKDIFMKAWTANNIRVTDHDSYVERMKLQEESIRACNDLLALIQIARKAFHLSLKRVENWGKMTVNVKEHMVKWHRSDLDRYKEYK